MQTLEIYGSPPIAAVTAFLAKAALPESDLTDQHMDHFFYSGPPPALSGLIGLELHGTDALLRSLAVAMDQRTAGVGSALVKRVEDHARSQGVRSIFLLTMTAEAFFTHRGYLTISRERAPPSIRNTKEFTGLCPASSVLMVKELS